MNHVAENFEKICARIREAAARAGRSEDEITLVAVSKTHPVEAIRVLYDLGHRDFGENYVQEWQGKYEALPDDINWHFIGRLQSNKAKDLVDRVSLIHSVDRDSVLKALSKRTRGTARVLLQVNTGNDAAKGGVEPAQVLETAMGMVTDYDNIQLCGLMTIPPFNEPIQTTRGHFASMRELFGECRAALLEHHPHAAKTFDSLSMGMTSDFEVAIEEGATLIRVGTAIFGARSYHD